MTRLIRISITAALGAVFPFSAATTQSATPLPKAAVEALVDSMAKAYMTEKGPAGMSIAISRGNETLFERAYGVADNSTGRPATAATVFKIGSVSKQFTAVLILKQVERGKIALTDSIGRYLTTGLRPEWRSITLEQLLNHTSGLPNDLTREGPTEQEVSSETMIGWAARDTMMFSPGSRFAYSNVGYLLLGALVEKLYGKPMGVVISQEIAGPLGLESLGWCKNPASDSLVAFGHSYQGAGKVARSGYAHPSKSLGGGALCSTARDLASWNRALHGGKVLTPAMYSAMTTPRGASKGYGFGLQFTNTAWGAFGIYHLGGILGFSAQNVWFPAESLSLTILYNSIGNGFPTNFVLDVARAIHTAKPATRPSENRQK